ncbi:MAG: hypothetical protein AAGA30_08145 [Planctomycetota bacterium]
MKLKSYSQNKDGIVGVLKKPVEQRNKLEESSQLNVTISHQLFKILMIVDLPTLESLTVTFTVTAIRTMVEAGPGLLGGVAVAAWLRTQATPEKVQTIFSGVGFQGALRIVFVGMALPVCAIGILPVLRELRLLGLSTSKLMTLGIAAPLLNPVSLLFGLMVLSFSQYLMMLLTTGILAIMVFDISSRFTIESEVKAVPRPQGLTGATRLRNLLIASGQLMTGRVLLDLVVTIVIATMTLSLIRSGAFLILCDPSNRSGPALSSLLTLTQYVSPSRAIIQFGGIRDAFLSSATGLVVFIFGTGFAGASILTFCRWCGLRRMLAVTLAIFIVMGAVCYLFSYAAPMPISEVAETNVVDNLSRPSYSKFHQIELAIADSLAFTNAFMFVSSAFVAAFIFIGVAVRWAKMEYRSDDVDEAEVQNASRMSKAVPASQLGAVAVCGLALVFVLSAYIVFPSPAEVIAEMERAQNDAGFGFLSSDSELIEDQLSAWDSAAAKIPISATIRGSIPSPTQRELMIELRTKLRSAKDCLIEGNLEAAKSKRTDLKRLLIEIKKAFSEDKQ